MLKLLKYIDSLKYYCNIFDDYFAQEAVWRITDNTLPYDTLADTLLMNAEIDINRAFDFPKMTYKLQDSVSSSYIPDQLFIADIEPKAVNANLNEKVNFTGSVTSPSVGGLSTGFSWIIKSPDPKQIVSNGSSASLVPLLRGIYTVSLNISVKDSTGSERNFKSSNSSYAVAADKFTETFEHNNLNDLFTWETYGDAPWTITNTTAQTGNSPECFFRR